MLMGYVDAEVRKVVSLVHARSSLNSFLGLSIGRDRLCTIATSYETYMYFTQEPYRLWLLISRGV